MRAYWAPREGLAMPGDIRTRRALSGGFRQAFSGAIRTLRVLKTAICRPKISPMSKIRPTTSTVSETCSTTRADGQGPALVPAPRAHDQRRISLGAPTLRLPIVASNKKSYMY